MVKWAGSGGGVWRPEQSCDFHSPDHFLLQPFQTSGNLNIPCRSSLIESTYDPVVFAVRLSGVFSCLWKLFPVGCGNILRPQTPEVSAEAACRERAVLSLFLFSLKALKQQSITSKPRTLTSALLFTGGLELPVVGQPLGSHFAWSGVRPSELPQHSYGRLSVLTLHWCSLALSNNAHFS